MAHALPLERIATADVPARASPSADADADALVELAARAVASTALKAGGSEAGALPVQLPREVANRFVACVRGGATRTSA